MATGNHLQLIVFLLLIKWFLEATFNSPAILVNYFVRHTSVDDALVKPNHALRMIRWSLVADWSSGALVFG